MNILENASLKRYNTFGMDVKAKILAEIFNEEELKGVLGGGEFKNYPKLILGGGSNILLTKDFNGLVIKISIPGIKIIDEDKSTVLIQAGAGVVWHNLVLYCVDNNFGGIENLSLIPGTAGAAPIQNIGAYGQELKNVFFSLKGISIDDIEEINYESEQCKFGYRDSIFKHDLKEKFIITSITLRLQKNPEVNLGYEAVVNEISRLKLRVISIKDVSKAICEIRKRKLPNPTEYGNAGSFFKNPEIEENKFNELKEEYPDITGHKLESAKVKVAAGWLIEKCGWKGRRKGNTGTHTKQSLVLINYGGAKGEEILHLAEEIKNSVYEKFKINLSEEVNIY